MPKHLVNAAAVLLALWVGPAWAANGLLTLGAGGPSAAVGGNVTAQDGASANTKYQANSNSFTYANLTVSGGLTNPGLVCWVLRAHGTNDVSTGVSLSWGAQSMTLRQTQTSGLNTSAAFLFGLRNPTSGNQTLTVSATNVAADNFVNCFSFSNVNQTSDALAFPNPTGASSASSVSVTSASGHIAVGAFLNGSGNGTIIGTIVISDTSSGSIINAASDYVTSVGASTTVGTTTSQSQIAGMDISN